MIHIVFVLAWLALAVGTGWGWILNIIALAHADAFNGLVALRCVGVLMAPLGAVLGWFV